MRIDRVALGLIFAAVLTGSALAETASTPAGAPIQAPRDAIPAAAMQAHQDGQVVLDCPVIEDGRLNCAVLTETPEGWGFGDAAVRLSQTFRVAARTADGRSTGGGHVRFTIAFSPATAPRHMQKGPLMRADQTLTGLIFAGALMACSASVGSETTQAQTGGNNGTGAVVSSENYETGLYREIAHGDGNQLISPFSARAAFSLLYPGARGATADEMTAVFGFTGDDDPAGHEARLVADLESSGVFKSANAVWVSQTFTLDPGYTHEVRDTLHAQIEALDFRGAPDASRLHINGWVASQTNDRIPDLLSPGFITPDMQLVLTNAVYFKADWMQPFAAGSTQDGMFHPLAGADQHARLMHSVRRVRYFEGDGFQAADFDFKDGRFALTIFLPRERDGVRGFEQHLTGAQLHGWLTQIDAAQPSRLDVTLPKVQLEQRYELGPALQAIGVRTAFTNHADLTGISANGRLGISRVVQNTFFAMDEVGVEAAAATGIGVVTMSMPRPEAPPIVFNADHPFFLVLRDRTTGTITFMGRVTTLPS